MYYHGTTVECGKDIIVKQLMYSSYGDDHWLGDGSYFYKDEVYSFRWILMKYTNNFTNEKTYLYDDIYVKYMILHADIEVDSNRLYSLIDIETKVEFLKIKENMRKKQEYSERYADVKVEDGVVINILFEDFGYKERYDAVDAIFPICHRNSATSRQEYLQEYQICVRNMDIIKKIEKHNDDTVPDRYKSFITDYNIIKFGKKRAHNINNKRKNSYKNKFNYKYH